MIFATAQIYFACTELRAEKSCKKIHDSVHTSK